MKSHKWIASLLMATTAACATEAVPQISVTASTEVLPYYDSREFTPRWLDPEDLPSDLHAVPAFSLHDQHGATITNADVNGKVSVVNFFFTACQGICPKLAESMSLIDVAFADEPDLVLLSHSVTPETDTVSILKRYADTRGITSERWHLLTGDRESIYHLGRSVYFVEEDLGATKGPDDFLHTENVVLVDRLGHVRGVYNGLNTTSVNQLLSDAKALLLQP